MFVSYKGRRVDYSKKVKVYRNLHQKDTIWSIKQGSLIVGHANSLYLKDVNFVVSEAGRQRVLAEKVKNVHAYVTGYITHDEQPARMEIYYNPYAVDSFVQRKTMTPIYHGDILYLSGQGKIFL